MFQVKFFQCYLIAGSAAEQNPPRCLHKWSPHGGKPVSFIHFLDDHKDHNPEVQFWKFAVTGESLVRSSIQGDPLPRFCHQF